MPRSRIALIRRVFDGFTRRDVEAVLRLCDPAIELELPTAQRANRGEPYRGYDGIRQYFDDIGRVWEELRVIPQDFRELEDGVFATGRVYARGEGGLVVDSPAFWLWRFREDRVLSGQVFEDRDAALKAAGLTGEKKG